MADALISLVVEQLSTYLLQEVQLTVGAREEVRNLTTTLKILQAVLDDAEEKQGNNKAVKVWLEDLKEISYDADDVLDEWQTRSLTSKAQRVDVAVGSRKKVLSYLLSPCSCFTHVSVCYDIGHRIKEISKRLDAVVKMKKEYGLKVNQRQEEPRQLTSSIVDVSEIHGRGHDKEVIMSRLLGESSHQGVSIHVISIVGMGGFGKTTLAKLIFNEENVIKTFEKKMWVCVSQPFDLIGVAKAIIEEAKEKVPDVVHGWEALHQCLCNVIKGKKFFLVLDDVWTDDPNDWSQLKLSLDGGALGSRIIVTTRNEGVANMMRTTHTHHLGKLSDEDSWQLLRDVALEGREQDLEKFEKTGKEIAKKCKGVPLAIKTLAGLLLQKRSIQDWRDVLESDLWEVAHIEKDLLPSFFLSYHSLPSSSKQCFMYCAIFPKDTVMDKGDLVKLWMAQGFLGSGGLRDLEKIGRNNFDNLAMRSFFQDFEKDYNGNITSCKMHDLVHDFAQFLTQSECLTMEVDNVEFDGKKIRHLCTKNPINPSIYEVKTLRSLIKPIGSWLQRPIIPVELFDKLPCLRALDLSSSGYSSSGLKELPNEVEKLLHVRYLDLSGSSFLELPETVSNLCNLQTLKLNRCRSLRKLPEGIGSLSNLRHLEIKGTNALSCLPRGVSRLSFLRTLNKFIIGGECKIGGLKHLTNLQGDLEIMGLEQISDVNEAAQVEMNKRKNLRSLRFHFNRLEGGDVGRMKGVLESLEPHENLEGLDITGNYLGSEFPCWMENISLLSNIVNMKLQGCSQCTELPTNLGKLASLEKLEIIGLSSVKRVGLEFLGISDDESGSVQVIFPKLRELEFVEMEEWEEWNLPSQIERMIIMPNLCSLRLSSCEKLRALPDIAKLESLETLVLWELNSMEELGEEINPNKKDELRGGGDFKPCLRELDIRNCPKLKVIPRYMFPHTLRNLYIWYCPNLMEMQHFLPPLMEKLILAGDAGVFSKSLPVNNKCSVRTVSIWSSPHSSLPKGFNQLELEKLSVDSCESLDFELKELEHLTTLQYLEIRDCPLLTERFEQGEDWRSILSHVAYIEINEVEITE